MPKTRGKIITDKFPPINHLRASILERKFVSGMTWEDIASACGYRGDYIRKLVMIKDPWEWPPDIRNGVCKTLQISIKRVIDDGWEDET